MSRSIKHADGLLRCPWPKEDIPLYVAYHDTEWGVPEYDDRALYEKLMLDGFQAGLSWITILRKRDNFRKAFDNFEPEKIARYTPKKVDGADGRRRHRAQPLQDRRRDRLGAQPISTSGKRRWLRQSSLGPSRRAAEGQHVQDHEIRAGRDAAVESDVERSFMRADSSSVGPTIVYAFMQAVGMVNDHLVSCHRHAECQALAKRRPLICRSKKPTHRTSRAGKLHAPRAWQRMLSGRRLDLLDPSPLDVEIEDIAHGLARVARWNGQTKGAHIFSVAQHTLLVEVMARQKIRISTRACGSRFFCTTPPNMSSAT